MESCDRAAFHPEGTSDCSHGRSPWRDSETIRPEGADEVSCRPGTFSQVLLHIVYSTKHRAPQITADVRPRLYAFIGGIVRDEGATLYAIGGIDDHVHHLIRSKTDKSIAELMRNVKARSSAWMHETFPDKPFAWQEGYSVFSVSKSIEPRVKDYIENQVEHHKKRDFREELLALLRAHEIEFEERYVFD